MRNDMVKSGVTKKTDNSSMLVNVVDWSGKVIGERALDASVFGLEYNQKIVHEVLRWQLNKRREPIQKAKNRTEVAGAHRKIRAQKGSGRARQGDGKAPHFRGGGVAFGINPRTYEFKVNKKVKKLALRSFLSGKAQANEIVILNDQFRPEFDKTKYAKHAIECVTQGKSCTIVCNNFDHTRGISILYKVKLLKPEAINIHSCMKGLIVFDLGALEAVEKKLGKGAANE